MNVSELVQEMKVEMNEVTQHLENVNHYQLLNAKIDFLLVAIARLQLATNELHTYNNEK